MPNGDPDFDFDAQEAWFGRIAEPIVSFAERHGLVLDKYYHDSPCWALRFGHPLGGNVSIQIINGGAVACVSTIWYLDDYDRFTRFLHRRDLVDVPLTSAQLAATLEEELSAILATPLDQWTDVAKGNEREWGAFTRAQFEAMGPSYPLPTETDG